ncbi:outer membrane protein assembly factor BamC [Amphritea pacifica]|uniref:Outer membrane protein assembly factor BamC n=1 Tax=Amphritea pacifica TaxID=2811233 RepID=A0ABS2W5V2_9GAMM|nr:outer membrane protein assembly factor BamC [Amphritea pacifica]MBN0987094.1 outer membrane protein assembly factor BamC [Amphritea pacifica]MBN1007173.1 outer membrane protein assembly factor BamC [Amphritea pacifica]
MRIIALLPLAAAVLSVAGCGSYSNPIYGEHGLINDRSQNYEEAKATQRLELPPAIQNRSKAMQDILEIPSAGQTASQRTAEFVVPRPEFFYADAGNGTVNLKRQGDEKVLIVDEPVGDVWIQLQDFWRFNNVALAKSAPREGVMETDWIDTAGEELSFVDSMIKHLTFQDIEGPVSDKLRVSVRPVADNFDRTTISMQHIRVAQEQKDQPVNWSADAADVGYKTDMMFEMLRYLSKSTSNAGNSLSLLEMKRQRHDLPQMGRDSKGFPALKITVPVDQAWAQINRAIDKTTLDVGTRDQQTGVIYLTYTTSTPFEDTEKMGFFEWLHSDRKAITFSTGRIGDALGLDADKEASGVPSYSSKQYSKDETTDVDQQYSVDDTTDLASRKGFKIWFDGKVIYIFGDNQDGVYNNESGKYEHVGQYQLHMNRTSNGVFLTVKTPDGYSAPAVIADEILWEIKEQI